MASQKFRDLVHYICWRCEDPTQLGATKLNKIPWIIDTYVYCRDGRSLTGETYIKQQFGPVARSMLPTLAELGAEGKVTQRQPSSEFQSREFVAVTVPDMSLFSEEDIRLIDGVIEQVCNNFTASSISAYSHDEIWEAAEIVEEIPMYAVLAANPGDITQDDIAWGEKVVKQFSGKR
jgi:hypothetical protein